MNTLLIDRFTSAKARGLSAASCSDAVWHWTATIPLGRIAFTNLWIVLTVPTLRRSGDYRQQRDEVTAIREWRRFFVRGFPEVV